MASALVLTVVLWGCGPATPVAKTAPAGPVGPPNSATVRPAAGCGGAALTTRFYDVGQALAVLVELPDGRTILVDTGEHAERAGCGGPCQEWSDHLLAGLQRDLADRPIDMLWITHQHSDHLGGAPAVFGQHQVEHYVDNGTRLETKLVTAARAAAEAHGTPVTVVDPTHQMSPLPSSASVTITAVVPEVWPRRCDRHPNDCSIGLRIDYCEASILFTGDAEQAEEATLDLTSPVTLLQVPHHGSATSSSPALLDQAAPRYAVISAAGPNEGTNRTYCHPRRSTVERLSERLGDRTSTMKAFAGNSCRNSTPADWIDVPASTRLFSTSRDGDVVLTTTGDGTFTQVNPRASR